LLAALALFAPAAAHAAGVIAGEVTAADGGDPIEGVSVCAYELGGDFEEFCDATDLDGEYGIGGLDPGQYKVEFFDESFEFLGQYYDDAEFWEDADPVTVVDGETTFEIDAELDRPAVVEGEVTAAAGGAPLEEVEVCAFGEETFRCDETGADGSYSIGFLWPGEYEIEFWPWTEGNYSPQWWQERDRWYEADLLQLTAGETKTGIDAELTLAGQIKGTVSAAATGAPLGEIPVCSIDPAADQLYTCVETSQSGQYTLRRLNSAQYKVVFSPDFTEFFPGEEPFDDGYPTQFWNGKPTLAAADLIGLTAPNTVTGIDARLGPPPPPPAPPAPLPSPAVQKKKKPAGKACRKGFKKKKVKGKKRCVKIRKGKKGAKGNPGKRPLKRIGAVRIQP
jgi:hypothetical protein